MSLYRVFAQESDHLDLPEGSRIEEKYPAFVIISTTDDAAEKLRKRYPVEKLKEARPVRKARAARAERGRSGTGEDSQNVVVRFKSPVRKEWLRAIEKLGAEIKHPLGGSAIVLSCPNHKVKEAVGKYEAVKGVEDHVPDIQLSTDLVQSLGGRAADDKALSRAAARLASGEVAPPASRYLPVPGTVIATFLSKADCGRAKRTLSKAGLKDVHDAGETALIVNVGNVDDPNEALSKLAELPGLRRLEDKKIRRLRNNVARVVIGKGVVLGNQGGLSLAGEGEVAAVADTGLDTGEPATIHADFRGRVKNIRSFPIAPSWSSAVTNPGGDDGAADVFSGHGTHTSGSVVGSGDRATTLGLPPIQGMAPKAKLVFQAIEQTPRWTAQSKLFFLQQGMQPPASGLYGIPDNLGDLFQAAYDLGARVHSNSWGGGDPGAYDSQCEAVDRFVWEQRDFLVVIAAGNDGKEQLPAGKSIAPGSVTPPATAKNCLTVGASENDRGQDFTDKYGEWWPDDFPRPPIQKDSMTDSVDDVVAFSSRGPCLTGRRKPDVVAPGTFVLSTRSSQVPANNFGWNAFPPAKKDYMYDGGTSMATPLVAGAAVLVRQYLRSTAGIAKPSAALLKAALIHSAKYNKYRFADAASGPWADFEQGWGRVTLSDVLAPAGTAKVLFFDEDRKLATGEAAEFKVRVANATVPFRVTLVYTDFPGETLVNNLNLMVKSPDGKFHLGNDFSATGEPDATNNVEGVVVEAPIAGDWTVRVVASEVQQDSQSFALVVSAGGAAIPGGVAAPAAASPKKRRRRR